uniref:Uncharacterized protein n=1 Tax=Glossina palpalis gambiensis TaxID=67801 RepID=A0A1B0AS78_9MUSC
MDPSSDNDCANIPNKRTRRCMRFPSCSEDEGGSNVPNQETEIGLDGTIWTRIEKGGVAGRLPVHSVFKDVHGPTARTKRSIMNGNLSMPSGILIQSYRNCTSSSNN